MKFLHENLGIFLSYIRHRIVDQHKNFIIVVCGETGSGKSWTTLRIAELLDPNFTIDKVSFTPTNFVDNLADPKNKYPLSTLIFEESGVGLDNRNFYKDVNKFLVYIFQTFRLDQQIVLLNLPDFLGLDSKVRRLVHCMLLNPEINYQKNQSYWQPYFVKQDHRRGKVYHTFMRYVNGPMVTPLKCVPFKPPSEALIKAYEAKAQEFKHGLQDEIKRKLRVTEGSYLSEGGMTDKQKEIYDMAKTGMLQKDIAKKLGVTSATMSKHIQSIKKKGYLV